MFTRTFIALNPRSVGIWRPSKKYGADGEATYHCGFPLRNAPVGGRKSRSGSRRRSSSRSRSRNGSGRWSGNRGHAFEPMFS